MDDVVLTWQTFVSYLEQDGDVRWIQHVVWANNENRKDRLPKCCGLYIIEDIVDDNEDGPPVYAGKAAPETIYGRFEGRDKTLRDFGLTSGGSSPVFLSRVRTATFEAKLPTIMDIKILEDWLIRILTIGESGKEAGDRMLQNLTKSTEKFTAPEGGLKITNRGVVPSYLNTSYSYKGGQVI